MTGCALHPPRTITQPPPAETHIETRIETKTHIVVHIEHVPTVIAPEKLQCPPDPVEPFSFSPRLVGTYIAQLTIVADQCRANLEALRIPQSP